MKSIIVSFLIFCCVCCQICIAQDAHPVPGVFTTTWLGNSIVRGIVHVPQSVEGICVTADGHVLTDAIWDEGDEEVSEFDGDGAYVRPATHTHGWGYDGGSCVAANSQYVFFGQRVENEGGGLVDPDTWPVKGKEWYGISRRMRSDIQQPASFDDGKGAHGSALAHCFLVVGEVGVPKSDEESRDAAASPRARVTALAASDEKLFAADPSKDRICVYDANTMALVTEMPQWPRVTAMALDARGELWIAQKSDGSQAATITILHGKKIILDAGIVPASIAVDPSGRIVVADGGRAAKILWFDPTRLEGNPTRPLRSFGTALFAGKGPEVGKVGPAKFSDLTGIAFNRAGDLFVSSSVTGTVLEKYDPQGKRLWVNQALPFVDNASIDPLTGDIFGSEEHYKFDWAKQMPGAASTYVGKTLDRFRFPDDVRIYHEHTPLMKRLNNGKLYAFTVDQMASGIYIYRFDQQTTGETAVPCACILKGRLQSNPKLSNGQFIWCDSNGDGRFDPDEIHEPAGRPTDLGDDSWGWWADDNGDVWQTVNGDGEGRGIRHFRCKGFDSHGSPMYGFDAMDVTPTPAPFLDRGNNGCERIIFDSKSDTMYLGGYTQDAQSDHNWGAFRVLARYDHWKEGNRRAAWVTNLPWSIKETGHDGEMPISVSTAGDYLFVVGVKTLARISVYKASDGTYVGDMIPNNGVFTIDQTGWVDMRPFGVIASKRPDGSYAVFVEEDAFAKTVIYRWKP